LILHLWEWVSEWSEWVISVGSLGGQILPLGHTHTQKKRTWVPIFGK
jgi:hypothetical protein